MQAAGGGGLAPDGSGPPVGSFPAAVAVAGSTFRFRWTVTERFLEPDASSEDEPEEGSSRPVLWQPDVTIPRGSWRIVVESDDPVHVAQGKGKGKGGTNDPIVSGSWTARGAGVTDFQFEVELRREGTQAAIGLAETDSRQMVSYRSSPYGRQLDVMARND